MVKLMICRSKSFGLAHDNKSMILILLDSHNSVHQQVNKNMEAD
jgi:hypothetical protein